MMTMKALDGVIHRQSSRDYSSGISIYTMHYCTFTITINIDYYRNFATSVIMTIKAVNGVQHHPD